MICGVENYPGPVAPYLVNSNDIIAVKFIKVGYVKGSLAQSNTCPRLT